MLRLAAQSWVDGFPNLRFFRYAIVPLVVSLRGKSDDVKVTLFTSLILFFTGLLKPGSQNARTPPLDEKRRFWTREKIPLNAADEGKLAEKIPLDKELKYLEKLPGVSIRKDLVIDLPLNIKGNQDYLEKIKIRDEQTFVEEIPWDQVIEENTHSEDLKEIYNSIKDSPNYPEDFTKVQNGTKKVSINNDHLLKKLRQIEPGEWKKVYQNGYSDGEEVSIHYFQHTKTGKVFNVKVKPGWSTGW